MDNPEKLATLGTHHTGQINKYKTLKTKIIFTRYVHIQNIGKPNDLKVFGVGKSKGI
jgi:hypothetical protein